MRKIIVALLVGVLTLTGCTSVEATPAPTSVASFYNQKLTWTNCGTQLKCSTVRVPIDYSHPAAGSIKISINWLASTGSADLGWLLENPGGPGGSGAYAIVQALIARGVIGDFRAGDKSHPAGAVDILRFGFTPLYLGFEDVWNAVEHLRLTLESGEWQRPEFNQKHAVT